MNKNQKQPKPEAQFALQNIMPRIGQRYSIIENGKRIYGTVESYQGDTGKFWVRWDDLEITLEENCDAAL